MALGYIIEQFCRKLGLQVSDPTSRALALKYINPAAKELYHMSDMAGCLGEQLFKVNANQEIAFPAYIGILRAMRDASWYGGGGGSGMGGDYKLLQMRPNYNQFTWDNAWKGWRIKNTKTLQMSLQNQSQLIITVAKVENPPIIVNISGPTLQSSNATESVTMTATSMNTQNNYIDVTAFTKTSINLYDVKLLDINQNQISYVPNNQFKAMFQIVDVSMMPGIPQNSSPTFGWVEVLFKKTLPILFNDSDEFPAVGYDDVIWNKGLQIYYEEQKDVQSSMEFYQKANQMLAQIHEDVNRGTDDVVSLVENKHDTLFPRTGWGRDWCWAWRITGR